MKETTLPDRMNTYFNQAAQLLQLTPKAKNIIKKNDNEITFHFPAIMDNGDLIMITGYKIQHNNILGPYKGSLHYLPLSDKRIMQALAMLKTWKAAVMDIPMGGSAGVVFIDPSLFSFAELERITRRYIFDLGLNIGPEYDIVEPGINTNSQIMAWVHDTYLLSFPPHERNLYTHIATGKPVALGGSLGSDKAPGQTIYTIIKEWQQDRGKDLSKLTFMMQGFGNTGYWVSSLLCKNGAKFIGLEDKHCSIFNPSGMDPEDIISYIQTHRSIKGYARAQEIDHESFISKKATVLILAAAENQINKKTVSLLNTDLIIDGIDNSTDGKCSILLHKKGIEHIPDIFSNTGLEIIGYFEWLQQKRSEKWNLSQVNDKISRRVISAFHQVKQKKEQFNTDWKTAAYVTALSRIDRALSALPLYP